MENKPKFTPGPWVNMEDTDGSILIKTHGTGSFRSIAVIPCETRLYPTDWDNAHLIASAPELYVNIQSWIGEMTAIGIGEDDGVSGADAVDLLNNMLVNFKGLLSKARGEI